MTASATLVRKERVAAVLDGVTIRDDLRLFRITQPPKRRAPMRLGDLVKILQDGRYRLVRIVGIGNDLFPDSAGADPAVYAFEDEDAGNRVGNR